MSKHWKPGTRPKVEVRPSRVRRRVPLLAEAAESGKERKTLLSRSERDMWGGIAGILLLAVALVSILIGIAAVTFFRDDPAAATQISRWGQCYNGDVAHCVLDGDTIYAGGAKFAIGGMDAPQIQGAECAAERSQGVEAAVRLADLLNSGNVTAGKPYRDESGRNVRKVKVNGADVSAYMIDAGLAREPTGQKQNWCGSTQG